MTKYMPFVYDKDRFFTNDKSFILTGDSLYYLTAFLNSKLFKFAFKDYFPELLGESREIRKVFFEKVSVMKIVDESWFKNQIDLIIDMKKNGEPTTCVEDKIDKKLFEHYNLSVEEQAIIQASVQS